MSVNNVRYQGDDPEWARAVEAELTSLRNTVDFLTTQLTNVNRRINQ